MNKKLRKIISIIVIVFSNYSLAASNDLHKAVEENNIKKINELVNKDATLLTGFDEQGNTPIHKSILDNKSASLQAFMEFKKVINMQISNSNGDTPLVFAIKNNKYNSISFILDNGINPFYKDKKEKNSLEYVKIFGDNTTKKIYNDYYERNKDKIKKLQENYKSPLDLSLFKEVKKESKNTTVQDLLLANKNKKEANNEKKYEEVNKEELLDIKDKIDSINIDKGVILGLEDKLKELEENNKVLKRKLRFKENTGKEDLTATEEIIVGSLYGGIYEQQVMFEDNFEDVKLDLFDQYTVVKEEDSENSLKNNQIDNIILKSNNYLEEKNKNLIEIEKDINENEDFVKKEIESETTNGNILLPISKLPVDTVKIDYIEIEDNLIKQNIEIKEINKKEKSIELLKVMEKEIPILSINKKIGTPELKVEINKDKIMNSSLTPLIALFLIFLLLAVILIVMLFKTNKKVI